MDISCTEKFSLFLFHIFPCNFLADITIQELAIETGIILLSSIFEATNWQKWSLCLFAIMETRRFKYEILSSVYLEHWKLKPHRNYNALSLENSRYHYTNVRSVELHWLKYFSFLIFHFQFLFSRTVIIFIHSYYKTSHFLTPL